MHKKESALKGRRRLSRPFRADFRNACDPRAHALGSAAAPLRGLIRLSRPFRADFRNACDPRAHAFFLSRDFGKTPLPYGNCFAVGGSSFLALDTQLVWCVPAPPTFIQPR